MLTRLEQTQQKYGGANTIIDNWLTERQSLLVKFCQLAGIPPYENSQTLPTPGHIGEFCEILVDYLSAGHFEVFNDIVAKCQQHGPESAKLAETIYPQISATTNVLVDFNDKYAELINSDDFASFDDDLSKIGPVLEERFELEDELIHTLYSKHI